MVSVVLPRFDIGSEFGVARSGGDRMQPRKGAVPCLRFWFVRQSVNQRRDPALISTIRH